MSVSWLCTTHHVTSAEIKIVYAVNPSVASQLYEVDVFMFFLQDLEAVSNNFYHDLWQAVRLHTPKVCQAPRQTAGMHCSALLSGPLTISEHVVETLS